MLREEIVSDLLNDAKFDDLVSSLTSLPCVHSNMKVELSIVHCLCVGLAGLFYYCEILLLSFCRRALDIRDRIVLRQK